MGYDRDLAKHIKEKFPPKIMIDRRGKKRLAIWCLCCCNYELREEIRENRQS